jgi:hypothetical protein
MSAAKTLCFKRAKEGNQMWVEKGDFSFAFSKIHLEALGE